MPSKKISNPINLIDLIGKIKEPAEIEYSNFTQFVITNNELFMDFYFVSPNPGGAGATVKPVRRIILPLNLAKGSVEALANAIADYEADRNITLPNSRGHDPDDKMHVWKTESEE